jgi:hypothetical protein
MATKIIPGDVMETSPPRTKDTTYKNTVDILNEMIIDGVHHYAIVDIDPIEFRMMQNTPPKI